MGHGREGSTHPQWLGFPLSEQDSPGLFTHRPQTPQRSFQGAAAGTHATQAPNRAHSGLHGETGSVSGGGRYLHPRTVSHGSETLRGQVSERQTLPLLGLGREVLSKNAESLRNSDALMRVAVPRRRGPAGLRDPVAVSLAALMGFAVLLSRFVGTQKIERLFFSYSGAFFEPLFASIHARNLSFGTTIRLPILSAGNSLSDHRILLFH